jgi:hypothetical protein
LTILIELVNNHCKPRVSAQPEHTSTLILHHKVPADHHLNFARIGKHTVEMVYLPALQEFLDYGIRRLSFQAQQVPACLLCETPHPEPPKADDEPVARKWWQRRSAVVEPTPDRRDSVMGVATVSSEEKKKKKNPRVNIVECGHVYDKSCLVLVNACPVCERTQYRTEECNAAHSSPFFDYPRVKKFFDVP